MAKIDWSVLGASQTGLAVEGKDDKRAFEAFLGAGEREGHWSDWRGKVRVEVAGDAGKVIQELDSREPRVWGLIDRDWHTNSELVDLQRQHPQLLVLPRVTLENYLIDPDELVNLLPPEHRSNLPDLKKEVEKSIPNWIQNGALWQILHENGAHSFCQGHEDGYPMAILREPVTDEEAIAARFQRWYGQLDPNTILPAYRDKVSEFSSNPTAHYRLHIHGKNFFNQVVVQQILNPTFGQESADRWSEDLFSQVSTCPVDLIPLLQRIVT